MRRLAAHLALAAIWLATLAPFVNAAEAAHLPVCCLRNGMHHCQGVARDESRNTELRARASSCPHSAPLPLTSFTGLNGARFDVALPTAAGFVSAQVVRSCLLSLIDDLSARAPPVLL
jgi:hypothetical protein